MKKKTNNPHFDEVFYFEVGISKERVISWNTTLQIVGTASCSCCASCLLWRLFESTAQGEEVPGIRLAACWGSTMSLQPRCSEGEASRWALLLSSRLCTCLKLSPAEFWKRTFKNGILKRCVYIYTLSLACGFVSVPPFFPSQWEEGYPMGMQ